LILGKGSFFVAEDGGTDPMLGGVNILFSREGGGCNDAGAPGGGGGNAAALSVGLLRLAVAGAGGTFGTGIPNEGLLRSDVADAPSAAFFAFGREAGGITICGPDSTC